MNEIYLDNSATTRPLQEALDIYMETSRECYSNPSAMHSGGLKAEHCVQAARGKLSRSLGCRDDEIIFTSGGTESDQLAILGTALKRKREGKHLITSRIEHHAVLKAFEFLEQNGYEVTYIDALPDGKINLEQLKEAVREDTILISVMLVNNETGTRQPVEEIAKFKKNATLHTDAVQAYGKISVDVKELSVDLLSISAHKVHGVKGVGALYIKKGTRLANVSFGGGQEQGLRSGTLNTPAIAAFGVAADRIIKSRTEDETYMRGLKDKLEESLLKIDGARMNGTDSVNVLNISFQDVRGEVLLHSLESKGIYISTGSACTSKTPKPSHVLDAMGMDRVRAQEAVRISISADNTEEEIEKAVEEIRVAVEFLRKFKRR